MDIQAKLFFELVDKDGNGTISKVTIKQTKIVVFYFSSNNNFQIEMKQFLAIHHLKRTGDFPKASDQEELEDVMQKIFKDKVNITLNLIETFQLQTFLLIINQMVQIPYRNIVILLYIQDEMTVDEFLNSDHGMITMVTFNLM